MNLRHAWRDQGEAELPAQPVQPAQDSEEIMLNIKAIAFSTIVVLGAWGVAATIGLGALAIASSDLPVVPSITPQIDTAGLMAKAGDLPVEIAPAP